MFTKKYYSDTSMSLPDLEGSRSLYLTLYDAEHPDSFLACAKINEIKPKHGVAKFGHDGIRGHISIKQTSPFHPAVLDVELNGLHDVAGSFHIHQYPVPTRHDLEDVPCAQTGGHFNPFNVDKSSSPPTAAGSVDQYEVGDLSGKFGDLTGREEVAGLASPDWMFTGELPLLLLPRSPPRPRELAPAPAPAPSSTVLKLETLLMLITFFISLRVALGVTRRLPFVSPGIRKL